MLYNDAQIMERHGIEKCKKNALHNKTKANKSQDLILARVQFNMFDL